MNSKIVERRLVVASRSRPVMEIDSQANAAYVRFGKEKVARTVDRSFDKLIVTVDLNSKGGVVGVEILNFDQLKVEVVLKKAHVEVSHNRLAGMPIKSSRQAFHEPVETCD